MTTPFCGDCRYAWFHVNDKTSPCYDCKNKRNFIPANSNSLDIVTLEYAAKWIENSLVGETNERVIEFGKNMAMSIRAAKTSPSDVSMTQDVSIDIKTPSSIENTNPSILRKTDGLGNSILQETK